MWIKTIDQNKVAEAIESSGQKKSEICFATGIQAPALSNFLQTGKGLSEEKVRVIARHLNCDIRDWLWLPEPFDGLSKRDIRLLRDFIMVRIEAGE